jgi:CheY-like chemotaxis protein
MVRHFGLFYHIKSYQIMELLVLADASSVDELTERIHLEWTAHLKLDTRKSYDPIADKGRNKRQKNEIGNDLVFLSSQDAFTDFLREEKDAPKFILIIPELDWSGKDFEGYELALQLLNDKYPTQYFNLIFLSALDRPELLAAVPPKHRGLVKTFLHRSLLEADLKSLFQSVYTDIHFALIRSLILSNEGRLNNIDHELTGLSRNVELLPEDHSADKTALENHKRRLLRQLDELTVLEDWIGNSLQELRVDVKSIHDKNSMKDLLQQVKGLVKDLQLQKTGQLEDKEQRKKLPYRVLIIEDEPEFRSFSAGVFTELFRQVTPAPAEAQRFDMNKAIELVKKHDYDVLILDLLYKDRDDNWLLFNGLDLFQLAKKRNPDICIRIITSLPRDIVAKTATALLDYTIPIGQVITKNGGFEALKYIIRDRVTEIDLECMEIERTKRILKFFPKGGVFGWPAVPTWTMELMADEEKFEAVCLQAKHFFELFSEGRLTKDTEGWDAGKTPSSKKKTTIERSHFLKRLPVMMGYRLIALYYAAKHPNHRVDKDFFEKHVMALVANAEKNDDNFFHSKLGFSRKKGEPKDAEVFPIEFKDLFPHEIDFLSKQLQAGDPVTDEKQSKPLLDWFRDILLENQVYQNWEALDLSFNPYDEEALEDKEDIDASDISTPLTLDLLSTFLQRLADKSRNQHVQKIIEISRVRYNINEKSVKLPPALAIKIANLFDA